MTVHRHVHIGTGAFGLGFIVPTTRKAGMEVVLANRAGESSSRMRNITLQGKRRYNLVFRISDRQRIQVIRFNKFLFTDEDREELLNLIAEPKTRLVTTALRQGVSTVVPILTEAIARRIEVGVEEPLAVVACEAPTIETSASLREKILQADPALIPVISAGKVSFSSCIVDRICGEPTIRAATNMVRVRVENFGEWLIEADRNLEAILTKSVVGDLVTFVNDLAPFANRKRCLVNGPHLLLALNAFSQGFGDLRLFLREMEAQKLLAEILEESLEILLEIEQGFTADDLRVFTRRIADRFSAFPDETLRHLSRFSAVRLEEFFGDFHGKVGSSHLVYMQKQKKSQYRISETLFRVLQLISEGRYVFDREGRPTLE